MKVSDIPLLVHQHDLHTAIGPAVCREVCRDITTVHHIV